MPKQIEGQCSNCGHKVVFTLDPAGGHIACSGCSVAIDPKAIVGQLVEILDRLDEAAHKASPDEPG